MDYKEDWATGSQSAAVGGVTCVFEMPNTSPPVDTVEHFELKRQCASAKSVVDFGIYGLLDEHNLDHLEPLAKAGAIGFKLFLGNTTGNLPCPNDGAVLEAFEIFAQLGVRCSIHAENSPILFWRQNKLKAVGRKDPLAHLAARTDVVAVEALNRSALFAEWTGARIHIVHESCARSIPFIRFWKDRGVDMTVETLPQYLYLHADMMLEPGGEVIRMNPPIRERAHQEPLWQALKDGTIDMLSTDHAPHLPTEKRADDIWDVACGFPGVQVSLPLMLSAVHEGRLQLKDIARTMAAAPARAFGLYGKKGVLQAGADADIVVVDLSATQTLSADALYSKSQMNAFGPRTVTGLPVMTFVRGTPVAKDGAPIAAEGHGQLVTPSMATPTPCNLNTTMHAVLTPHQKPYGDRF
jgi:dihydroorotase